MTIRPRQAIGARIASINWQAAEAGCKPSYMAGTSWASSDPNHFDRRKCVAWGCLRARLAPSAAAKALTARNQSARTLYANIMHPAPLAPASFSANVSPMPLSTPSVYGRSYFYQVIYAPADHVFLPAENIEILIKPDGTVCTGVKQMAAHMVTFRAYRRKSLKKIL